MTSLLPSRWSIKTKSLVLFVGYALALGAVYAAFTVYLLQRETDAAHDRLEQTAHMLATELDSYIQSGRQRLVTVSKLPGLVYGLRTLGDTSGNGPIAPWTSLHYLFFRSPVFTGGVFLVDRKGVVLWTEPPGRPWVGRELNDHRWLAEALARGGSSISDGIQADSLLERPHVIVSASLDTPDGERAGALAGLIDLTAPEFTGLLRATSTEGQRFAALVDQSGAVLASTGIAEPLASLQAAPPGDDQPLLASALMTQAPWKIITGQPRATALADIRDLQRLLLWLGLVLTLAVLAFGMPFVRGFVGSVQSLTTAAEIMAEGDLSRPVVIAPRHDELATLASTFERMRGELERSRGALQQRLDEREELIKLKEDFLANISHELRTPLNVIIGYTDMLLDEPLAADQTMLLRSIRSQSEHLFCLLRDLLTLSDLNTGRIVLEVGEVAVPDLLGRLEPLVNELSQGKDVRVEWECPPSLPHVCTDAQRLEQVLANLITNAFKFTPQGTVAIRARHDPPRERVVFEVADTGVGIPGEELAHIFDEFRQADGSMSRRFGGVGLGLALVRKLTALMHGEASVRSDVDKGSTFTVAVPLVFPGE